MFQRVVVPLDGSEFAECALLQAEELAGAGDGRLHLLRIVDLAQSPSFGTEGFAFGLAIVDQLRADEWQRATTYLTNLAERLRARGCEVTTEVREGHVTDQLLAAISPEDLVVMSSRGRGGLMRWALGSVTDNTLRHSLAPVLVVRPQQIACELASVS